MKRTCALLIVAAVGLVGCKTYGNDEGARYLQRKDSVTLGAGDAPRVNAMSQTVHPWPAGVGDRRIPMDGNRAVRAMECYRQGSGKQLVSDSKGSAPNQQNIASGANAAAGGSAGGTQLNCGG